LLSGLSNKNTNKFKVARVASQNNLVNKFPKTSSNNNLNNTNIMNISSNTDGVKSTRNKSTKIGFYNNNNNNNNNNISKSKDKSFQIENEEEKAERIKNIRKK